MPESGAQYADRQSVPDLKTDVGQFLDIYWQIHGTAG